MRVRLRRMYTESIEGKLINRTRIRANWICRLETIDKSTSTSSNSPEIFEYVDVFAMDKIPGLREIGLTAVDKLPQFSWAWTLVLAGLVTLVVVASSHGARRKVKPNLPPGPRNWPIIGALLEMEPLFHKTLEKLARKYGPVVLFRMGAHALVVVSSPEAAEELLKHKDADFSHRAFEMNRSNAKYAGIDGKVVPFANCDAELTLHRKLCITENLTSAKIKTYEKVRARELALMVEKIFAAIDGGRGSNSIEDRSPPAIDMRAAAMAMMHNVLFTLSFGKRFDSLPPTDRLREHTEIADEQMKILVAFNVVELLAPWLTWLDPQGLLKRMKKFYKRHIEWLEMVLERNRQEMKLKRESGIRTGGEEGSSMNFVRSLLLAQEIDTNLTDKGVMAMVDLLVTAGLDTTSLQVDWTMLEIARHLTFLQRLQHEIDGVVGKERPLEEADLQAMPFLNAVILESLRLHPAVPLSFPHVNLKPSTLCGYDIPANTGAILNIYGIGRDPNLWKDPTQFNPDRFMAGGSSDETIKANGFYYKLLPFSSGRRGCLGYNLAFLMISRAVGTLVHAFDWSPPRGISREDLSVDEAGRPLLMQPSPDVYLVATPRLSCHVYKSNIT